MCEKLQCLSHCTFKWKVLSKVFQKNKFFTEESEKGNMTNENQYQTSISIFLSLMIIFSLFITFLD